MPVTSNGVWLPDLFGKQWDAFNSYDRALLLSGPRLAGKTWVGEHKVIRHMWETPKARVGIFTKVLKNSKDAGIWKNLSQIIMPEWLNSGIGDVTGRSIRYLTKGYDDVPGPKVDGTTRTPFFRINNMHGGESECMLFSLDNDNEAEAKLKEREFSLLYFSELSNFMDRKVLSIGLLSLRMPHLAYNQQQWIADTNPAEEGELSWIYETWWLEKNMTYEQYCDRQKKLGRPIMKEATFVHFQSGLRVIEFTPKENPKLKPGQLEELESAYSYDPGLYARFMEGKWVYGDGEASLHFKRFFKPNIHVVGKAESPDEDEWEIPVPSETCYELVTGWDTGDVNHAAVIMERRLINHYLPRTKTNVKRAHFVILAELVSLNTELSLEEFTNSLMEIIEELEVFSRRTFDLSPAYSDISAIERYSSTSDTFPAAEIRAASLGRIDVIGVPKAKGSVRVRVQLLQQLLAFNRIQVAAQCYHTLEMLKKLKKGKDRLNYVLQSDPNRHVFDAITYALLMECADELEAIPRELVAQRSGLCVNIR